MADSGYVYLVTHANAQGLHKIGLTRTLSNALPSWVGMTAQS